MANKYEVKKLTRGWAIVMKSNQHIMEVSDSENSAFTLLSDYESGTRVRPDRTEVWLIDESFISEPHFPGIVFGEVPNIDLEQYNVTRRLTQEEFDSLMEEYFEEYGQYPE